MQEHWFTFAAQVVNFLILVWLLKRFLYGPILRAIDGREQQIADRLQAVQAQQAEAQQTREQYEDRIRELDELRETMMADARGEVESWRKQALDEVRAEMARTREQWHRAVERDHERLAGELRQRTAGGVQAVARHVLRELSDQSLEEQTVRRFLDQFPGEAVLPPKADGRPHAVVVRTAYPLTEEHAEAIRDALGRSGVDVASVRFETSPELICGIEVVAGDHKFQWNIDDYLESLEHAVTQALDHNRGVAARSEGDEPREP